MLAAMAVLLPAAQGCGRSGKGEEEQTREYPVQTVTKSESVSLNEEYSAKIEGRQDVAVYPQLSGKLTQVCIKEGQRVGKGQLLFVIDQVPHRAALQSAVANVHAAQSQLATARLERDSKQALYDGKVISEYELQSARNALASAQAQLEQARAMELEARNNLSYTEIRSPVDGVVGVIPYRVGALVSPDISQPLTHVSDNSTVWAYFSISEKQYQQLMASAGMKGRPEDMFPPVKLRLVGGGDYPDAGRVESVSGIVDPQTGAVQVKCEFPNRDRVLLSGSTGNIVMPRTETDVILVPKNATYEIQDKIFVYVVDGDKVASREITVSPFDDGMQYIVRGGLKEGERIVTEGVASLSDGKKIKTREARR